jgi:DNA sulfur modification protein DndE
MLREIRPQGVSVILLSQGIEKFNQPSFDFSTICNLAFLLKIKDINLKQLQNFLDTIKSLSIILVELF